MADEAAMQRPYDYIASDMDGTLLRPSHLLSPLTLQTLKTIVLQRGIPLILATGRNYADVQAVNTRLQEFFALPDEDDKAAVLHRPPTYLITSNGAVVHDARTRQVVTARYLDPAVAKQLYWLLPASETEINTHAYQRDAWWCRHDWPAILEYHKISGLRYTVCAHPCAEDGTAAATRQEHERDIGCGCFEGVSKLFYECDDMSRRAEVVARVRALFDEQTVALTFSGPYVVEVMAANVNKGSALCTVLRMMPREQQQQQQQQHDAQGGHGATVNTAGDATAHDAEVAQRLRRTIAFGDELNDVEMLRMCGQGCLMGNGNPKVKECCPHVECIASNAEDGMARKLCSVFGLDCAEMEAKGDAAVQRLNATS